MNKQNIFRTVRQDYLLLIPIAALAFYIAFIPHQSYPYPLHLDEWNNLACSQQIINQATAFGVTNPYTGGPATNNQLYEVGYQLFWAVFHQICGLSWHITFRYFPSMIFMITILSVYIMARREGFGWEAAFFTALMPTTVGVLGPAFMVPMALNLMFIPLSLFVVFNYRTICSYLILFIFVTFMVSVHPPTAAVLIVIFIPFILLNLKGDFKHSLGMILAVALPFLLSLPWTWQAMLIQVEELLNPQTLKPYVDYPHIFKLYGYFPIALSLLGTFLLAIWGGKKNYGLILGWLLLMVVFMIFYMFHYGISIFYERGLVSLMFVMSIVTGAALMWVRKLSLPAKLSDWIQISQFTKPIGIILCIVVILLTLVTVIPARHKIPYYYMINTKDYEVFIWIKENVDSKYKKAILDPWKATAFTAITGRQVYSRIGEFPTDRDNIAYSFLRGGCQDTSFLMQNDISIVYTEVEVHNPDLEEVRENIHLLK